MRSRQLIVALVVFAGCVSILLLVILLRPAAPPAPLTAHGVLLEVQSSSIVHAERLTLRTDDGRTLIFQVDPEVATNPTEPQSASHLRQHMAAGDPLIVHYRATRDSLIAVRVQDGR